MVMNWDYIKKYMNSDQLFSEFAASMPAEAVVPAKTSPEWHCCVTVGQWCVELQDGTSLARLLDTARQAAINDTEIALYAKMKHFLQRKTGNDGTIKQKIALVLSGGGAKGAYQIGVWEALEQLGLCQYVEGIAGTSIGAVNAMLFARGEYLYAKELWLKLSETLTRAENRKQLDALYKRGPAALGDIVLKDRFLSQAELKRELSRAVSNGYGDRIKKNYHIYTAAVAKETWERGQPEVTYMPWNVLSNAEIVQAVLASSALPLVYSPVEFKGNCYYDGGLKDNAPVLPLYQCGYRRFIVIHLQRESAKVRSVRSKLAKYGGCRAVHIVPGKSFEDNAMAMLKLTPEATLERMQMGRNDTLALRSDLMSLIYNDAQ